MLPMNNSAPLLSTAELERLQRQTLMHRGRRRTTAGAYAGPAPSIFRGRGMELEDVRAYQPGDDVRHMDWRATARTNRPITKVFRDERQQMIYLVIDRGPTMFFGTRGELKAASAARVAAVLAFSALAPQERVAGLISDPAGEQAFPKTRGLAGALKLLQAAAAPAPRNLARGAASVANLLEHLD